jgi:NAD(P)-dependent dehydrogenase (short-subunit alcohol dehydrogenase family)
MGAVPVEWGDVLADALAQPAAQSMAGRTALVAGGGLAGPHGSIGFSIAWLFAREGARVVIADRDADAAARAVELITEAGGEAASVSGDLASDEDCRRMVTEAHAIYGVLDAVATTIGRGDIDGILDVDRQTWDQIIEVNLTAAWQLIRHAAPLLPAGSSIVTTSSGAAQSRGPGLPYSIAKAALEQLTIGAAATLAPQGIRVNAVRVGTIWSTFAARSFSQEIRAERRDAVALRTEGTVWDIAAAAVFLSGDRARWISGQVLAVDGGGPTPAPPGHVAARAEEKA